MKQKNRTGSMKRRHLKNISLVVIMLSLLLSACGSGSTGYTQGANRSLTLTEQTTASEQEENQEISSESTSLTEEDSIESTDLDDADTDSDKESDQYTEEASLQEEESIAASRSEEESIAASRSEEESIAVSRSEAESIAASRSEEESIAASRSEAESIAASIAEAERIAASIAAAQTTMPVRQSVTYIGNANTKKFHYPYCRSVNQMNEENKVYFYGDRSELINQGYVPCKNCNP